MLVTYTYEEMDFYRSGKTDSRHSRIYEGVGAERSRRWFVLFDYDNENAEHIQKELISYHARKIWDKDIITTSMNVRDLIAALSRFSGDLPIMLLDGENGGGLPRDINLIRARTITEDHAAETADCEDKIGQNVVVLGHGCY